MTGTKPQLHEAPQATGPNWDSGPCRPRQELHGRTAGAVPNAMMYISASLAVGPVRGLRAEERARGAVGPEQVIWTTVRGLMGQ